MTTQLVFFPPLKVSVYIWWPRPVLLSFCGGHGTALEHENASKSGELNDTLCSHSKADRRHGDSKSYINNNGHHHHHHHHPPSLLHSSLAVLKTVRSHFFCTNVPKTFWLYGMSFCLTAFCIRIYREGRGLSSVKLSCNLFLIIPLWIALMALHRTFSVATFVSALLSSLCTSAASRWRAMKVECSELLHQFSTLKYNCVRSVVVDSSIICYGPVVVKLITGVP